MFNCCNAFSSNTTGSHSHYGTIVLAHIIILLSFHISFLRVSCHSESMWMSAPRRAHHSERGGAAGGGASPDNDVLLSSLPSASVGSLFFVSPRFCSPISIQPALLTTRDPAARPQTHQAAEPSVAETPGSPMRSAVRPEDTRHFVVT